jgi:hypothetical protein
VALYSGEEGAGQFEKMQIPMETVKRSLKLSTGKYLTSKESAWKILVN